VTAVTVLLVITCHSMPALRITCPSRSIFSREWPRRVSSALRPKQFKLFGKLNSGDKTVARYFL